MMAEAVEVGTLIALRDECTTLAGLLHLPPPDGRVAEHDAALAHAMGRLVVRLNYAFQVVGRPPSTAPADDRERVEAGRAALLRALGGDEGGGSAARDKRRLHNLLSQLRESEALLVSVLGHEQSTAVREVPAAVRRRPRTERPHDWTAIEGNHVTHGRYSREAGPESVYAVAESRPQAAVAAVVEAARRDVERAQASSTDGKVRALAVFAAYHPGSLTREQVAGLAGMAVRGGGFGTVWRELRVGGLVEEPERGRYRITRAGLAELGDRRPPVPRTPSERVELWGRQVSEGGRRMLDALSQVGERGHSRLELASRAGFAPRGGAFAKELRILRRANLVAMHGRRFTLHAWLLHGPRADGGGKER